MTEAEFWKEQFLKVTTHWYNKEQPNMDYKEFIAVKERRCEDVKVKNLAQPDVIRCCSGCGEKLKKHTNNKQYCSNTKCNLDFQ